MVFSTIGAARIPGTITCSPGLQECCLCDRRWPCGSPRPVRSKSGRMSASDSAGPPTGCCLRAWPHTVPLPGGANDRDADPRASASADRRRSAAAYELGSCCATARGAGTKTSCQNDQDQCKKRPRRQGQAMRASTTQSFLRESAVLARMLAPRHFALASYVGPEPDRLRTGGTQRHYIAPECANISLSLAFSRLRSNVAAYWRSQHLTHAGSGRLVVTLGMASRLQ